ncbi:MAG: DUF3857 and transglutaminase domain-containing protein [Phycisphaerae bacterium]|nr:DUF3857 and transglutaminase domain-containing protein [Saprospiraceae bacterium]
MKNLFLGLFALCSIMRVSAQTDYSVASIPLAMRKNADAVVRRYELKFKVLSKGEAIETEHKVITLLNDQAADENDQAFWYDQIREIDDIEGAVYDASGKLVRKIKKKDIVDQKPFEEVFVDDTRYKRIKFPRLVYPYTIEYLVVKKHRGLMYYPIFEPQSAASQSVESASFELLAPDTLQVRYMEVNVLPGQKTGPLQWEFHNLCAFQAEPFLPVGYSGLPKVMSAPTLFKIEGYEGDMSTWASFGKFLQTLNAGKDNLPIETVNRLRQLTADCPDQECKARRVYEVLQNSTRYYFVGFGIGGWQPMPARDVDRFKYSDCKGLSNYTMAMLRAVGVPAYYALIRASEDEQNAQTPEFPNPWFNHATLCIPLSHDTIWLECTSQQAGFGFLSDFTDDRLALVVFPEGGKILQTPRYDESSNTIHRETAVVLAADGSARLQSKGSFRAIEQDIPAQLAGLPDEQRKKYLYQVLGISDFEITGLEIERNKDRLPVVLQTLSLEIPRFAAVSNKRLFLPSTLLSNKIQLPVPTALRQHPVQAHARGVTEDDTINITIPEGYTLENGIPSVSYSSVFGSFEMSGQYTSGQITVYRKLVLNSTVQPREKYEELLTFLKNISKADLAKLVLVR